MNVQYEADVIKRAAERLGYGVHASYAATGTVYLTCEPDDGDLITVRVADHGECYCGETISVDPDGCSKEQAVTLLARQVGRRVPGWVTRNNRRRGLAEIRSAIRAWRNQAASQDRRQSEAERVAQVRATVANLSPSERALYDTKVAELKALDGGGKKTRGRRRRIKQWLLNQGWR